MPNHKIFPLEDLHFISNKYIKESKLKFKTNLIKKSINNLVRIIINKSYIGIHIYRNKQIWIIKKISKMMVIKKSQKMKNKILQNPILNKI
jgi:hypothetical protein